MLSIILIIGLFTVSFVTAGLITFRSRRKHSALNDQAPSADDRNTVDND